MAETLRNALASPEYEVPDGDEIRDWLRRNAPRGQWRENPGESSVSLQLIYIYSHPSKTGWLSRQGFNEYMEFLPIGLNLLDNIFRLTDIGAVLKNGLMSENEKASFKELSDCNPIVLDNEQQLFFIHQLLEADGDFLVPFCTLLLYKFGTQKFSYLEAGSLVPSVIAEMIQNFSGSIYSQEDRDQFRRLNSTKTRIESEIENHIEKQGSGSRREQTTIPRLEWLVDLGIVSRQESRNWRFTDRGVKFVEYVSHSYADGLRTRYPENVMRNFLDSEFFGIVAECIQGPPAEFVRKQELIKVLAPSYKILSDISGYCLLRPLVLLHNCRAVGRENIKALEYDFASSSLPDLFRENPGTFDYTINRFNTDYQIRIDPSLYK